MYFFLIFNEPGNSLLLMKGLPAALKIHFCMIRLPRSQSSADNELDGICIKPANRSVPDEQWVHGHAHGPLSLVSKAPTNIGREPVETGLDWLPVVFYHIVNRVELDEWETAIELCRATDVAPELPGMRDGRRWICLHMIRQAYGETAFGEVTVVKHLASAYFDQDCRFGTQKRFIST